MEHTLFKEPPRRSRFLCRQFSSGCRKVDCRATSWPKECPGRSLFRAPRSPSLEHTNGAQIDRRKSHHEIFGSERLTGALLDRLTHHVHILEMNGDSYRLKQSKNKRRRASRSENADASEAESVDPSTGEIVS